MEKGKRYLKGRIWVDQKDLQIVVTSAKNVPDDMRKGHEDCRLRLPPTVSRSMESIVSGVHQGRAELHFAGGSGYMSQDVRIRQIVKYTDYKQFRSTVKLIFQGQDVTTKTDQPSATPPANGQPAPAAPPSATAPH